MRVNDSDGSVGTKYRARNFALEYVATVAGTEYAQVPWAEQVCQIIISDADNTVHAGMIEDQRPGDPSLEPDAGAVPQDQVEGAAATMRKAWQTKEFSIALQQIEEGKHVGKFRMTLWACNQKFQKEHYERTKRLQKLMAPGGAHDSVASQVVGQHGLGKLGHNLRAEEDRIEG